MSVDESRAVQSNVRPRPVIVKYLLNKSKMKVLVKRRNLKGKEMSVAWVVISLRKKALNEAFI